MRGWGASDSSDKEANDLLRPLRSKLERTQKIISALREAIVWTDLHGKIQGANAAFTQWIGLGEDEILGKALADLLPLEDDGEPVSAPQHPFHAAARHAGPGKRSCQYLRGKQRIEVEISWVRCVVETDAEEILVFTIQDITESKWAGERESELLEVARRRTAELEEAYETLKAAQQGLIQAEKLSAMGRFASGLAHEVKNPLAIILAGVESLERKVCAVRPDLRNDVDLILEAVHRANSVVQGLLQFAKPSSQHKQRVQPEVLLQTAVSLLKHRMLAGKATVGTDWSKDPLWIEVDKNQVEQVFLNLLMNALDAMPRGGRIRLKTCRDGEHCVVSVADQGGGILKEHWPHLFEPFFTTKRAVRGVGLGLSVSKSIVENCGGTIEVESEPGKGAVFRCRFPMAPKEHREGQADATEEGGDA